MHALEDDRLFDWSVVQQFCSTASALPPGSATLGNELAHPMQTERPAGSGSEVVELYDEVNVVSADAPSGVGLSPE